MSHLVQQERYLEDAYADFDTFLSQGKFEDCAALIENVGELGYESEALYLHKKLNDAKAAELASFYGDSKTDDDIKEAMLRAGDDNDA